MFRCPGAEPVGQASLDGWELEFRRVLTIVRKPGGVVEGGLWLITDDNELALDRYEGYPGWYKKALVMLDGGNVTAMTYILDKGHVGEPTKTYLDTCVQGCFDFGIDPATMFKALDRCMGKAV